MHSKNICVWLGAGDASQLHFAGIMQVYISCNHNHTKNGEGKVKKMIFICFAFVLNNR